MPPAASAEPLPSPAARPPSALSRAWRGWPGVVARIAFAVLPLVWLAQRVTLGQVAAQARAVGIPSVLGAFTAFLAGTCVAVVRWTVLLRAYGATGLPPFRTMARHLFVALYFNVLPSGLAGDLVRSFRLREHVPTPAAAYAVVFVERLVGLVGLLVVAAGAATLGSGLGTATIGTALAVGAALAAAGALVLLATPYLVARSPALARAVERAPIVGTLARRIPAARSTSGIFAAVLLSLFTQAFALAAIALLTRPLVSTDQLAACVQVMPLAILLTYVPLTPGGVMQREAVFVLLFGLAGVSAGASIAVSLLVFVAQLAVAGLGGLVHATEAAFGWERGS